MRQCIFCQERASTKEDVWPLWLTKRFPSFNASGMEAERGGRDLGNWRIKTTKLLPVRCVCAECNNGWMSQLEAQVKPLIESILDDQMRALDISSQAVISVWVVKTAMTLEALYPDRMWFYTNDQRRNLRIGSAIPERTSVWLAKCVDHHNIYSEAKDHWTAPGQNEAHAYATTIAFGSLALQVVSLKPTTNLPKEIEITYDVSKGPWEEVLTQVWPITPYPKHWPSRQGLNGEVGLEALANRLNPT